MAKAVKAVVAVAIAVAIPFVAPAIAASIGASAALTSVATTLGAGAISTTAAATIGTTIASAGVGAVLGAANAKVTGGDVKTGALMGGLTGGFGGYTSATAGLNTANAPVAEGAAANVTPEMTAAANNAGTTITSVAADGTAVLANGGTVAAGANVATAPTITGALKAGLTTTIANITSPETLGRLTVLALAENPDVTGLSAEEAELVQLRKAELQRMASENRALFEQQVLSAQEFMQAAGQQGANPEAAYAETKIRTERELAEDTRGLSSDRAASIRRGAQIGSTEAATVAAAAEQERGSAAQMRLRQAGLSALPTAAPEGYAGLATPLYADLAERRRQAQGDLVYGTSRALGLGDIGGSSNKSSSGLYGNIG